MHNSESFWKSVDRPPSDERHALLIDVVNKWDFNLDGHLIDYLCRQHTEEWLCNGLVEAYKEFRSEARRLNRVEYVEDAKGGRTEVDAMDKWICKHYPYGFDEKSCGFSEFSRLLDEHPV